MVGFGRQVGFENRAKIEKNGSEKASKSDENLKAKKTVKTARSRSHPAAIPPPGGMRRPPGGDYEGVAKTGQSQPKDFRASKTAKRRQGLGNIKKKG